MSTPARQLHRTEIEYLRQLKNSPAGWIHKIGTSFANMRGEVDAGKINWLSPCLDYALILALVNRDYLTSREELATRNSARMIVMHNDVADRFRAATTYSHYSGDGLGAEFDQSLAEDFSDDPFVRRLRSYAILGVLNIWDAHAEREEDKHFKVPVLQYTSPYQEFPTNRIACIYVQTDRLAFDDKAFINAAISSSVLRQEN